MSIQLFVPSFRIDECLKGIRECLEKGWTGAGFKTVEFEEAWKEYAGLSHAHFLSSNTVGLHLALHVLKSKFGWADDDEVITTPLTFVSTNHAILHSRLRPVFADVRPSEAAAPVVRVANPEDRPLRTENAAMKLAEAVTGPPVIVGVVQFVPSQSCGLSLPLTA